MFNLHSKASETERWRCQERSCSSVAVISNKSISILKEHNHASFDAKIEKIKIKNKLQEVALKGSKSSKSEVTDITKTLKDEEIAKNKN